MKRFLVIVLAVVMVTFLASCGSSRPKSLEEVSEQLTQQFRTQHEAHKGLPARPLKSVKITRFILPPSDGVPPHLGLALDWGEFVAQTSVPMVQLGDGLIGITYTDGQTHEELSAVLSFR